MPVEQLQGHGPKQWKEDSGQSDPDRFGHELRAGP